MYKVGEHVVYGNSVCLLKEISKRDFGSEIFKKFYVLIPDNDKSTTINVPVEQDNCSIRNIICEKEAKKLIKNIPEIELVDITNERMADNDYKELISSGEQTDLIRIIKTTYLRNKARIDEGKKVSEKDNKYLEMAENMLYSELAVSLGMNYEKVKEHVIDKVSNI